jgi:membrane protease YdiL (CAAX protease family)
MRKGSGKSTALKLFFYFGTILILIAMAASLIALYFGYLSAIDASVYFTVAFSLLLSFLVVSYLLHKGKKPKKIIQELGLSKKSLTPKMVGYGLIIFAIYVAIILAIAAISSITGTQINSNVQQTIGGFPIWAIVFIAVIAPINEEITFRGFLVPRIGIIPSGLLFAALHFGYGSISEIVIALWFGLTGGYVFKKTKSLYPSLITHMMVNTITAIAVVTILPTMLTLVHP